MKYRARLVIIITLMLGATPALGNNLFCHLLGIEPASIKPQTLIQGAQTDFAIWKQLRADYKKQGHIDFTSSALLPVVREIQVQLQEVHENIMRAEPFANQLSLDHEATTIASQLRELNGTGPRYLTLVRLSKRLSRLYTAALTHEKLAVKNFDNLEADLTELAGYGAFVWIDTKPFEMEHFAQSYNLPLFKFNLVTENQSNDGIINNPNQTWNHDWSHSADMMRMFWIPLAHKYNKFSMRDPDTFITHWNALSETVWQKLSQQPAGVIRATALLLAYYTHESPEPEVILSNFQKLSEAALMKLTSDVQNGKLGPRFAESFIDQLWLTTEDDFRQAQTFVSNQAKP